MAIRKTNRVVGFFKLPEVQFFLIFIIPFTGAFLINYFNLPEQYQMLTMAVFACTFIVVLFQTIYSVTAHRRMRKEENSFISVTAHQMRTPLTAVRWVLQELAKSGVSDADRTEFTRMGGVASQKLSNIIDDFSEIAKIEDGQLDFHFAPLELAAFARQMITEAEPVAKQYGVTISGEISSEPIEVMADQVKLEIMFSNLINNAIKYNKQGGLVTVRVRRRAVGGTAEISVSDTGIGMSASDKEKIFTKFFRSDEAKRKNPAGTGLGLYLVRSIVLQHRGSIWLESTQGIGSTFFVTLPTK